VFLKIFYNLSKLLIISNLTLQTFIFMTFYTELIDIFKPLSMIIL